MRIILAPSPHRCLLLRSDRCTAVVVAVIACTRKMFFVFHVAVCFNLFGGKQGTQLQLSDVKCKNWQRTHHVEIGQTWGSLPSKLQAEWKQLSCDEIISGKEPKQVAPIRPALCHAPLQCQATASVRGNLSPVSVVLNSKMDDWLKDRWQAAKDMSGSPILGEHWVLIDLQRSCSIKEVVLDWETAFASEYEILASPAIGQPFHSIYSTSSSTAERKVDTTAKQHVVHTIGIAQQEARLVKLVMTKMGTAWGASLWRFDVLGEEASQRATRTHLL
jgi:hypothetical protein